MPMDLTGRIIGAESGGNPLARNPRSSAGGLGQFINSTWLSTIRKHRPDLAGRTNSELLQLKFDPSLSKAMTAAYAADNQGFLKSKGIDPNPGNTYLAHFAGPQGAAAIHANPNAPVEQLLGARAVAANPFLRGKTGADVINWASGKVGAAPASSSQATNGAPMATPIGGAPIAGGPVPLQQPNKRYSKLADMLMAQAAGAKVSGWGDALRAAGGAALGYSLGNKADDQETAYRSKLAEALSGTPNEDLAKTLIGSGDEDLMKAGVQMRVAQAKPQNEIGRFRPTKQGIVDTATGQIVPGTEQKGDDNAEYGTSPQYIRDKDGKLRIGQLSKAGGIKMLEVEGDVLPGIDKIDTGTEVQLRDKRTGDVIAAQPKNIVGKESQEEVGKSAGQATVALPAAKTMVDNAFKTIGELRAHPGLEVGTGASNVFDPRSWVPGTQSYDFQAKNKQATGQSFMAARDSLKGAGQVTDFEGAKGEQAIANLDAAQSKEQYLAALDTLEKMMRASYDDLQRKAGMAGGGAAAPTQQAPQFDMNAAKQKYGLE